MLHFQAFYSLLMLLPHSDSITCCQALHVNFIFLRSSFNKPKSFTRWESWILKLL